MIVVTGAAGFIGSSLVSYLNSLGIVDIIIVDEFNRPEKQANYEGKKFLQKIERSLFLEWFENAGKDVEFVFHIGARTDTAETDNSLFDELNFHYSISVWNTCARFGIPLVYASSAATYGDGKLGYSDDHEIVPQLQPLNPYGWSKQRLDQWALRQEESPPRWYGLKFFNVYGPNEYHKGRMASVVYHAYKQISENKKVRLFRSHRPEFKDGMQLRDFIYVMDVVRICAFFKDKKAESGLYNVGTGKAASFIELVEPVFNAMDLQPDIEFIDIPEDIRDNYQYFTEAKMEKLRAAGYTADILDVSAGVRDYLKRYLSEMHYF